MKSNPASSLYSKSRSKEMLEIANFERGKVLNVIMGLDNNWLVVLSGRLRPLKIFSSEKEAIAYARNKLKSTRYLKVVVHGPASEVTRVFSG